MILLFISVIMVIFALVKRQYKFVLLGAEAALYGSLQELLQKPELVQYAKLLGIGQTACLFVIVLTVILFAMGGKNHGE